MFDQLINSDAILVNFTYLFLYIYLFSMRRDILTKIAFKFNQKIKILLI